MKWLVLLPEIFFSVIACVGLIVKRKAVLWKVKMLLLPEDLKEYLRNEVREAEKTAQYVEKRNGTIREIIEKADKNRQDSGDGNDK